MNREGRKKSERGGGRGRGRQLTHRDVDFPKTEPGLELQSPRLQPSGLKEKFPLFFFIGLKEKQKTFERAFCLSRKGHHPFL